MPTPMPRTSSTRPNPWMVGRFCAYTTLRNLRFFEPFFVLYLLIGLDLSYVAIGALLAYEKVMTGLLEAPLGVVVDRWGRRRGMIAMFGLTGLAFVIFAWSAYSPTPLAWLWVGQTFLGVGESLRTGTHKAIMLDWLRGQAMDDRATSVIGLTRVFSKSSAGVGAMVGGLVVWLAGSFVPLFWAAAVPCGLGAILMWTYPRELEGEWSRETEKAKKAAKNGAKPQASDVSGASGASSDSDASDASEASGSSAQRWWPRFRRLLASPGIVGLIFASVVFETQIKLGAVYLQPYLKKAVNAQDLVVLGGLGAVVIGVYYLIQGLAAGGSSSLSSPFEKRMHGRTPALRRVYLAAVGCFVLSAGCLWLGVIWPGLIGLLLLACAQNLRRPIFVSRLNELMDPYQRGTTLSIESQARNWLYAALALITGFIAEASANWGLAAVFTLLAALMILGLIPQWLAGQKRTPVPQTVSNVSRRA